MQMSWIEYANDTAESDLHNAASRISKKESQRISRSLEIRLTGENSSQLVQRETAQRIRKNLKESQESRILIS